MDRNKNWLVTQAINAYLKCEAAEIKAIHEADENYQSCWV